MTSRDTHDILAYEEEERIMHEKETARRHTMSKKARLYEYTPPKERYEAMRYTEKNRKAVLKWIDDDDFDVNWYAEWRGEPLCFGDWLVCEGGYTIRYTDEDFIKRFTLVNEDTQ